MLEALISKSSLINKFNAALITVCVMGIWMLEEARSAQSVISTKPRLQRMIFGCSVGTRLSDSKYGALRVNGVWSLWRQRFQ